MASTFTPMTLAFAVPPSAPGEARQYAEGCLRLLALYASHAAELAEVGDDLGLGANMLKVLSAAQAAAKAVAVVRAANAR